MKDASHALNSGLVFSSSSRKCQVFKMIYCHAVTWGDGHLGNGLREDEGLGSGGAPESWSWPAGGLGGGSSGPPLHLTKMEARQRRFWKDLVRESA